LRRINPTKARLSSPFSEGLRILGGARTKGQLAWFRGVSNCTAHAGGALAPIRFSPPRKLAGKKMGGAWQGRLKEGYSTLVLLTNAEIPKQMGEIVVTGSPKSSTHIPLGKAGERASRLSGERQGETGPSKALAAVLGTISRLGYWDGGGGGPGTITIETQA